MTQNELIYEAEADSQTQRTDLWLPKGKWVWGGMGLGLADANYYIKLQGPTVQHRELSSISWDKP